MRQFEHGGDIYSDNIKYDFSANINPLGMPESVKKVLAENIERFEHYPDCECRELVAAICRFENINLQKTAKINNRQIVCGNGAADLIYRLCGAIKPKKALLPAPTFSEYEKALQTAGCEVEFHILKKEQGFSLREDILERITEEIDIIFLCNPNNPIGNTVNISLMEKMIQKCLTCNTTVVVDECFLDFTEEGEKRSVVGYLKAYPNVIVLKAFTKIFAMAGLRLGYLLCGDEELCESVREYGQCWSVSVPAQLAGIAALSEQGYIERTRQYIKQERRFLSDGLKGFGCEVYDGEANFIFFRTDVEISRHLRLHGIAVRNCANYRGLEQAYARIAVRTHEENEFFLRCFQQLRINV